MNDTVATWSKLKPDDALTPPNMLAALGPFDLDPCAAPEPRPWPTASVHWTASDKPLKRSWTLEGTPARVWLNPPHSGPWSSGPWLRKMADHNLGTALSFAWTDTEFFHAYVWPVASAVLFIRGRLSLYRPDGRSAGSTTGAPSCLIAYGQADAEKLRDSGLVGKFVELNSEKRA